MLYLGDLLYDDGFGERRCLPEPRGMASDRTMVDGTRRLVRPTGMVQARYEIIA